eukprot:6595199-Pyramimonas_sp.AAC.1
MRRAEAGPPPPNARDDEIDPCRTWVGGFPRAILESHRRNHFEAVKQKIAETEPTLGTELSAKFHKVSMSYSIHCENDQHAKNLRAWA